MRYDPWHGAVCTRLQHIPDGPGEALSGGKIPTRFTLHALRLSHSLEAILEYVPAELRAMEEFEITCGCQVVEASIEDLLKRKQ